MSSEHEHRSPAPSPCPCFKQQNLRALGIGLALYKENKILLYCPFLIPSCYLPLDSVLVKVKVLVAQLCPTFWNPMDGSLPGSSVHGILQARILE